MPDGMMSGNNSCDKLLLHERVKLYIKNFRSEMFSLQCFGILVIKDLPINKTPYAYNQKMIEIGFL